MLKACIVCGTPTRQARCPRHAYKRDRSGRTIQANRVAVANRDGHGCLNCGRTDLPLQLDHVMPLSQGGVDTVVNLRLLCTDCHSGGRRFDA